MFIAGILNMMKEAALLLFVFGLLLFIVQIKKEGIKAFFSSFANAGFIFLAISAVAYYFAVHDAMVTYYDDFSHWALITKQMLLDDRYPNFENVIMFQAYPPGSATFIYYFCTLSGGGEGIWIYAQGLLEIAFILPVFVFCDKKNSLLRIVYCLLFANFILCTMYFNYSLLVDILLAMAGAGSMFFTWYCFRNEDPVVPIMHLICIIPPLAVCILIKNSGILFAVLCAIYILYKIRKIRKPRYILTAVIPFLVLPLWNRHCDLVYENAALTKHAMSYEYMSLLFNEKPAGYLFWMLKKVILFSVQGRELYLVLLMLAVTALVVWLCAPALKKAYFRALIFCAVFYVIFEFGLYLVYIFSMSVDQGMELAGCGRYRRTALMVMMYVSAAFTMAAFSRAGWKSIKSLASFIAAFAIMISIWKNDFGKFYNVFSSSSNQLRNQMESMMTEYNIPQGASSFICTSKNGYAGMEYYLYPYLALSNDFDVVWNADEEKLSNAMDYSFLFILDEDNPAIEGFVRANFPEQLGKAVVDMRVEDEA